MSTSKLWTDFALKLHTLTAHAAGAVMLSGITSQDFQANLQTSVERTDGQVFGSFGSLRSGGPRATFNCLDLAALLDEVSASTGLLIDADVTHPGVVMGFQRYALGSTRVAPTTGQHFTLTFENGLVVVRSIELTHQGVASASVEIVPIATSSVDPVAYNEADTLENVSPTSDAEFTLGKVDLNGTVLEGIQSVSIDFGVRLLVDSRDSDIYPSFVTIQEIMPTVTIRGVHPDVTATLTEDGLAYAESVVKIYARKRAEGGTFVADGTAEHVLFTLGQCRAEPTAIQGDPKEIGILITPWKDTANPITVNTASAIT